MLSVIYAKCQFAECCKQALYAECHYAQCCALYAECLGTECRYAECRDSANIRLGWNFEPTARTLSL